MAIPEPFGVTPVSEWQVWRTNYECHIFEHEDVARWFLQVTDGARIVHVVRYRPASPLAGDPTKEEA